MQRFLLKPHPDYLSVAVRAIVVEIHGDRDDMQLAYRVVGTDKMVTPEWRSPARVDELWRTTCFELFLQFDDDETYVEFNFSPSTEWSAYAFDGYREGMTLLERDIDPHIERIDDGLEVALDLTGLPRGEHRMALTAVIEEEGGIKSYWSLAHPPGAPDFHHPACFAARLPAPDGP